MNNKVIEFLNSKELTFYILKYLIEYTPKISDEWEEVLALYFSSLPLVNRHLFCVFVDLYDRYDPRFKYITYLHLNLMKHKGYRELFYQKTVSEVWESDDQDLSIEAFHFLNDIKFKDFIDNNKYKDYLNRVKLKKNRN